MNKKILIELPMDIYSKILHEAKSEDRSVRSMINVYIKRGMAGEPEVAQPDTVVESQPKTHTKDTKNKPVSEMTTEELREEFKPLDRVLDNGGKLYDRVDRYKELGEEIEARGGYVEWPDVIE